jgi:integrase
MIEKSFGMIFFLKASKNRNDVLKYVYLRITVDGVAREFSTKTVWHSERWNQGTGRATGNREDARVLNNFLDMLSFKVQQARTDLLHSNIRITAVQLKDIVTGSAETRKFVLVEFQKHNDEIEVLLGKEYAPATLTRYKTSLEHTRSFIHWKYGRTDLELRELNYEFVKDFEFFLKSRKQCAHNSAMKYLANLKKIVLSCLMKGWLTRNPFLGYKMKLREVKRTALTQSEVNSLTLQQFPTARLRQVRDIFLFCCYTGLSYVDVRQLRQTQIQCGCDGEKWLMTSRQKTGTVTELPLLPEALRLIENYVGHPKCSSGNYVFPVLSNQRMNSYLKEIAQSCRIVKQLTFHIARHTFATTITLANGVPLNTVSKMLGHKTIQQTEHYAKLIPMKISADMAILKTRLPLTDLSLPANPVAYN